MNLLVPEGNVYLESSSLFVTYAVNYLRLAASSFTRFYSILEDRGVGVNMITTSQVTIDVVIRLDR